MQMNSRFTKSGQQPVVRISKGRFSRENFAKVKRLIDESAADLVPAIQSLRGLLYYHAGVDPNTNTVANVSIWEDEQAAKQMDTLAPMLAKRPILESAGVQFDKTANYAPAWSIEGDWEKPGGASAADLVVSAVSEQFDNLVASAAGRGQSWDLAHASPT